MHYSVVANNLLYLTPRNVGRIAQSIRSLPNTQGSGVRSPSKARSFFFLLVRRWYALWHLFEYLHGLAGIFHAFVPKFARKQNIILITFSSDIPPLLLYENRFVGVLTDHHGARTDWHFMWVTFVKNNCEHPVRGPRCIVPESLCYALLMKLRKTKWLLATNDTSSDAFRFQFSIKKMYCDIGFSIFYQSFNHRYHHKNFCFLLSRCFHSIY